MIISALCSSMIACSNLCFAWFLILQQFRLKTWISGKLFVPVKLEDELSLDKLLVKFNVLLCMLLSVQRVNFRWFSELSMPFFIIYFLPSLFKLASSSFNLLFLFCSKGVKSGVIKILLT